MDRRRFLELGGVGLASAALLGGLDAPASLARTAGSLEAEFEAAAKRYGVPVELLVAMGYVNARWKMPPAQPYRKGDPEGQGTYGIMALLKNPSRDTLGRASKLTGIPPKKLKTDRSANILGGAAVLASLAGRSKPKNVINGWQEAVARYGGGEAYAAQVFGTLREGASARSAGVRSISLAPQPGVEARASYLPQQNGADYGRAYWYGTGGNNYTPANRPHDLKIDMLVIHVTQSSWSAAINWFKDPRAQASAHYVVRSKDGYIGQSVREHNIAWHAGNWYYNEHSVGIEHEGYINDPSWFTDVMYRSSARLSAYLCKKYHIPIDRKHIIGHNQVPDPNNPGEYGGVDHHKDPGPYWNWSKYMRYIRHYANSTSKKVVYQQVVDNSSSRFHASKNWSVDTWNSERYGASYRVARPKAVSDDAEFWMKVPVTGDYAVYARWPAASDYNGSTPIGVTTTSGIRWVRVDQRKNGGRWVYLGSFHLKEGNARKVMVSRWTGGKGWVIADAVMIRRFE
jgi:N-acetyl-anhydromuramyl-L-alanine amidase AmpD